MSQASELISEDRAAHTRAALLEPERSSPSWVMSSLDALTQDWPPRIPERFALAKDQRRMAQEMCSRLAAHLAPASAEEIGTAFAMLRVQFPARDMEEGQARAVVKGFLVAMEGVPTFALDEGVRRVLRAKAGLPAGYMPTAPQLRQLVDDLSRPARWHARRLRFLLEAEIERDVSPEERERVAARFREFLAASAAPAEARA